MRKLLLFVSFILIGSLPLHAQRELLNPLINSKTILTKGAELHNAGKYKAAIVAKSIAMPLESFNKLNPGFDRLVDSEKPYSLKLPEDKIIAFANNKKAILSDCLQALLSK